MSGSQLQIGIYARVSTDQQATANTIESQLAALQQRVRADKLRLGAEFQFVDEGYSGATLVRPALERLRDDRSNWRTRPPVCSLPRSLGS